MTKLIIDGDVVAYRASAANESRSIRVTHKETGTVSEHAHRTALKEHIKDTFEVDEFIIEDIQKAGEERFAFHAAKTTIEGLCHTCEADEYEVYISGAGNFRLDLPLPTRYKSNRDGGLRPLQLQAVRDYLVKHHEAIKVDGKEPDDILAQCCYEGIKNKQKVIQATIDKDAYGYSGWLYNWTKMDKPMFIKGLGEIHMEDKKVKGHGRKWFFTQWVLGDAVDGFKPSEIAGKKFGDVAAYKLLNDCKTDKECMEAVYKQYKFWYPGKVVYKDWDGKEQTTDVFGIMDMYAACCHMQRWDGDFLNAENILKTLKIEY